MKWILIIAIIKIMDVISQFVNSDQVIVGEIELVSYSNPLTSPTDATVKKIIYFTDRTFQKIPKILLGFQKMDYDYNSNTKSFEIYYDTVTVNSFQIIFSKYFDTKVYNIIAMYTAINSDDAYSNSISIKFMPWPQDNFLTISVPYTRNNVGYNRKIVGYIVGLKSDGVKYVQRHKIEIKVEMSASTIDITAQQDDPAKSLSEIKVNYIEYYIVNSSPYYDLGVIDDDKYITSVQRTAATYTQTSVLDFSRTSDFKGVAIALNRFDIPLNQYSGRLQVSKQSYDVSTFNLYYSYSIWDNSQAYMFSATISLFKMKDCSKSSPSTPINFSFAQLCVNICPAGYSQKSVAGEQFSYCDLNICTVTNCSLCDVNGICIQCNTGYYFYKQQCYSTHPLTTFCDQKTLVCQDCKAECQTCSDNISCLSCVNGYFYNSQCTVSKPNSTFCDRNKICKSCNDNTCINCDENLNCISCGANQPYFFISKCYSTQLPSTYCDEQNICFSCHAICQECSGPNNNQCTDCNNSFQQLINSKCECTNSANGYDQNLNTCKQCSTDMCADCYGNYQVCLACSSQAIFVNSQCQCKQANQYYDSYYQSCFTTTVANCKIAVKTQNQCDQCLDGYFQDQISGKCLLCPNKVYADSQNRCILLCRANCLICINATDCIQEINANNSSNNNNNNNNNNQGEVSDCHFSCQSCSVSNNSKSCLLCSSPQTRLYNNETKECDCKAGFKEVGNASCEEIADLEASIRKSFKVTNYISLGIQAIFIFSLNSPDYQYIIILQQQLYLLTFFPELDSNLEFYNYLIIFRHFSLFSLFENIKLFQQVSDSLNCLIIYTSVLVVTILIALSFHFINFSFAKASYFRWNLVLLCSRLVSLFSFTIIFKITLQEGLYNNTFTLSVVSCFLFFYSINIALHFRGIYYETHNIQLDSSTHSVNTDLSNLRQNLHLKSTLDHSMEKPQQSPVKNIQEIEMISTFQQKQSNLHGKKSQVIISPFQVLFSQLDQSVPFTKYFWLFVEVRNISTGLLIGFQGDKIWAYYALPGISLVFIIIMSFNKIQTDQQKRKLVFYVECLVICIQVFFSFYLNQLSSSGDQNKILILIISCCIFIIAISIIIFHFVKIFDYLKDRLDVGNAQLERQKERFQPQNNMRMQNYFTKDQINSVLDQAMFNSTQRNPRIKRKYYR